MSVSRARCSVSTQRACGSRCDLPSHASARCRWRGRTAGVRPRIDGESKFRVQKKRLGSSIPHGAADDLRLSSSSTITRWKCTRPGALQEVELKSNADAFGRSTRCAFPNRFAALQQAIRLLWHIAHIERPCCHSRHRIGCLLIGAALAHLSTVIVQRNWLVGSACCSEDTSLRGPNVFKN